MLVNIDLARNSSRHKRFKDAAAANPSNEMLRDTHGLRCYRREADAGVTSIENVGAGLDKMHSRILHAQGTDPNGSVINEVITL